MLRLTAEETARAVGGRVIFGDEKQVITHISLDSRTAAKGDLFVPIIGERVDAHDFIGQVLKNGAAAVFTSRHQSREEADAFLITAFNLSDEISSPSKKLTINSSS